MKLLNYIVIVCALLCAMLFSSCTESKIAIEATQPTIDITASSVDNTTDAVITPDASSIDSMKPVTESSISSTEISPEPINTSLPVTYIYNITDEERELLAKLATAEAGICSVECEKAVISVVFNRLNAGYWGDTIEDIVYYKNAFSVAPYLKTTVPKAKAYEAVDYVLRYGCTVPEGVRYFRSSYDFNWEGYVNYCMMDNLYFGYFTNGNH